MSYCLLSDYVIHIGTSLSNHFQSSSQVTVQTHVGSDTESSMDLNSSFCGTIDSSDYVPTPENPNRFEPNFNMRSGGIIMVVCACALYIAIGLITFSLRAPQSQKL